MATLLPAEVSLLFRRPALLIEPEGPVSGCFNSGTFGSALLTTSSLLFGYLRSFRRSTSLFIRKGRTKLLVGRLSIKGKNGHVPDVSGCYGLYQAFILSLRIEIRLLLPSRFPLCASGATSARPVDA